MFGHNQFQPKPLPSATKRLLSDLRELQADLSDTDTITALPLENNLFEWHANIVAPSDSRYAGAVFHVVLTFPYNYPVAAPKGVLKSRLSHSHVFPTWICLDMLETHQSHERHSGWSSAYSIPAILLQLQAFLLEEETIPSLDSIRADILASHEVVCSCGHNMKTNNPAPWNKSWDKPLPNDRLIDFIEANHQKYANRKTHSHRLQPSILVKLPEEPKPIEQTTDPSEIQAVRLCDTMLSQDELLNIMGFLNVKDWNRCAKVCRFFRAICQSHHLRDRRELMCFHSKVNFEEDTLGIGINVEYDRNHKKLVGASSPLDIISYSAFEQGIRQGAWKETFEYFLPLYINPVHAKKAIPIFQETIMSIYGLNNFDVLCALDILAKIMKKMVVDVMSDNMHASIRALEGYCYVHRWMIHFALTNPRLQKHVEDSITNFLNNEKCRVKSALPDIGDFISLLSLSRQYSWKDVAEKVIYEVLDRNQLWIVKKHPELADTNSAPQGYGHKRSREEYRDSNRIDYSFEASRVSIKLQMFHVYFLTRVAVALQHDGESNDALERTARTYDLRYGKSTHEMQERLQREVFNIQKTDSYQKYFKYTLDKDFNDTEVTARLVQAMKNSASKGYHKGFTPRNSGYNNQGGYNNRGGYNNDRGNNQGGYNQGGYHRGYNDHSRSNNIYKRR